MTVPPLDSERDALSLPEVRAIYGQLVPGARRGVITEGSHRLLCSALEQAGVELGAYDHHLVLWLAGFGPLGCAAIAGWIERASKVPADG